MNMKTEAARTPHEPHSGRYSAAAKDRTGRSFRHMPAMTFVAPLLPGKEEEWRRFVQEVVEERLPEYEQLRQRLGIRNESVWLARTNLCETVLAYLEVESPEWIAPALATSEAPFDVWLKERLLEFHGHALVHAPRRAAAKLIFAYPEVSENRPLPFGEGSS
jgi:L-rhamnose mutarotase